MAVSPGTSKPRRTTVVDPFCGRSSILAAANAQGLGAVSGLAYGERALPPAASGDDFAPSPIAAPREPDGPSLTIERSVAADAFIYSYLATVNGRDYFHAGREEPGSGALLLGWLGARGGLATIAAPFSPSQAVAVGNAILLSSDAMDGSLETVLFVPSDVEPRFEDAGPYALPNWAMYPPLYSRGETLAYPVRPLTPEGVLRVVTPSGVDDRPLEGSCTGAARFLDGGLFTCLQHREDGISRVAVGADGIQRRLALFPPGISYETGTIFDDGSAAIMTTERDASRRVRRAAVSAFDEAGRVVGAPLEIAGTDSVFVRRIDADGSRAYFFQAGREGAIQVFHVPVAEEPRRVEVPALMLEEEGE